MCFFSTLKMFLHSLHSYIDSDENSGVFFVSLYVMSFYFLLCLFSAFLSVSSPSGVPATCILNCLVLSQVQR